MARCPTCYRRLAATAPCPEHGEFVRRVRPRSHLSIPAVPEVPNLVAPRLLATGGFATVWEATLSDHRRPVILKVGRTANELARSRFDQEASVLTQVGQPYVPELHRTGVLNDGRPFLLMEHLGRKTLASRLEVLARPPEVSWIAAAGAAILHSVSVVHESGAVHRDLKPENIFLSEPPTGVARLIDFGITKLLDLSMDGLTRDGSILGTPEYMAPEQITGDSDVDIRTDIYAFGIILYEFLTLRVPFSGEPASIEHGHKSLRPPRPSQFTAVHAALEDLCLSCLAKDPERRPFSAADLSEQLQQACATTAQRRPSPVRRPVSGRPASGSRLLTSAQQPVILLAAQLETLDQNVAAVVTEHKGVIARQWGRRYICAFAGLMDEDPIQEALAAAHHLTSRLGGRAVLHLTSLKLRRSRQRGALKVYGAEVEQPERWLPTGEWSGILLTAKIARVLPPGQLSPSPDHEGFAVLSTGTQPMPVIAVPTRPTVDNTELVGCADILAKAEASLSLCVDSRRPILFTALGEHGVGKSRYARELARLARRLLPAEARLTAVTVTRRGTHGLDQTCRLLLSELAVSAFDDTAPALADSELAGLALVRALGSGLQHNARNQPLVLVIDDAHQADNVLLDAVEYATLDAADTPLWVV
ncbi:MAG: protein kinase, partial [Myxococcota bacterium]